MVGVSLRTLSNIENDIGDQTTSSINKAFRPFGISVGLWPNDIKIIKSAVKRLEEIVYENIAAGKRYEPPYTCIRTIYSEWPVKYYVIRCNMKF